MNKTSIPWADFTWNPTTGCTFGCEWCYARGIARRFSCRKFPEYDVVAGGAAQAQPGEAFPQGFTPTVYTHRLDEPLRRKKPAVIFLGSMGDVFDPAIPDEFRARIMTFIDHCQQHLFVILTKRAREQHDFFQRLRWWTYDDESFPSRATFGEGGKRTIPNLVIGVSVTNQADADERIPLLLDTPAAKRMVSVEPMLGPVDLGDYVWEHDERDYGRGLDFVAVGGKTPGKPLHEATHVDLVWHETVSQTGAWLRSLRDQCLAAGVPFHYKHGGTNPPLDGVVYDARLEAPDE